MENSSIERAIAQAQQEQEQHFDLLRQYAAVTEALKVAEDAQVDAFRAALKDGWTLAQIKKIGLPEPNRKRRHPSVRDDAATSSAGASSSSISD